jgi:hypothetical protein
MNDISCEYFSLLNMNMCKIYGFKISIFYKFYLFVFIMEKENFMLISLDDLKAKKLADVLGNKTSKKFIDYLTDHEEGSAKDFSEGLEIPMNTVDYNVKKLLAAEIIQKKEKFFWSKKGKKIVMYELVNKPIIISLKNSILSKKLKSILPGFFLIFAGSFALWIFEKMKSGSRGIQEGSKVILEKGYDLVGEPGGVVLNGAEEILISTPSGYWIWFLGGGILALLIISIVNWRKL